jgi:copper(I)-binding protein
MLRNSGFRVALAGFALFGAVAAKADMDEVKVGDLVISSAYALETPKSAMAGAGYFTILNTGDAPDALIGVTADFPRTMIHGTETTDGIARMVHKSSVAIQPGGETAFEPGGLHVMFMGLNGDPFEEGETVPVTLIFEKAGAVELNLPVKPR